MTLNDEIYEWLSTLPRWQQELFHHTAGGSAIAKEQLDAVLGMVLRTPGAGPPREVRREDLPADFSPGVALSLLEIRHRQGVNRLADGEVLKFTRDGVTVAFGANGSGKSGLARIAKHAGRARAAEDILGDVYTAEADRPRPRAALAWTDGGPAQLLELELDRPAPGDLAALCVFDAASGERFLTEDHEIDYTPLALESVQRLIAGQNAMSERLTERIVELEDQPIALEPFPSNTRVRDLLSTLSAQTDLDELRRLATLDDATVKRREELDRQIAEIDGRNTGALAIAAERDAQQAGTLVHALRTAAAHVGEEALSAARDEAAAAAAAREVAAGMSSERFAGEPVKGAATKPWLVMWNAAQAFVAEAHGEPLPADHDLARCPLCMQELDAAAIERLRGFDAWVRSDVERQVAEAEQLIARRRDALPDLARLRETHGAVLTSIVDQDETTGKAVEEWLTDADRVIAALRDGRLDDLTSAAVCPVARVETWSTSRREAAQRHRDLENPTLEADLRSDQAELRAREALAERLESIERRVARLRERARLAAIKPELKTNALSTKLRTLTDGFVTEDLQAALREQLRALNFEDIELVGCRTSGRGGKSWVGLKIRTKANVPLRRVLSDGEQRRLALAFFLAEVSVAYSGSPVVLDDPVCSIDHLGRRHIAETLVKAAAERQVIVFTHELTFLHELQRAALREQVPMHDQYVLRSGGRTGRVREDLPWQGKTAKQRVGALRKDLQETLVKLYRDEPSGEAYATAAARFCVDLRQAFERALEDDVLGGVVVRGDFGVHPNALSKVAWSDEVCRLTDIGMSETSPWAHDQARTIDATPPRPEDLERGLELLVELRSETQRIRDTRQKAVKASAPIAGVAAAPVVASVPDDAEPSGESASGKSNDKNDEGKSGSVRELPGLGVA